MSGRAAMDIQPSGSVFRSSGFGSRILLFIRDSKVLLARRGNCDAGIGVGARERFFEPEAFFVARPLEPDLVAADLDDFVTIDLIPLPVNFAVDNGEAAAGLIPYPFQLEFAQRRIGV